MPDGTDQDIKVKVLSDINEISAEQWDACADGSNPFVSHAFLQALEESGSVRADTGWQPQHLLIEAADGRAVACAPLYLKGHSYGEYIFDWAWADAYERAGGRYFPKLLCAVPFTPATGPRLLVREGEDPGLKKSLVAAMVQLAQKMEISSVHINFLTRDVWEELGTVGMLLRTTQQFHWENDGYASFDDFLAALSSRKRKAIRKERRKVEESGLEIKVLRGEEIKERHWDAMYAFYTDTSNRKFGSKYLNRKFFSLLGEVLAERVVLIMVEVDDGDGPRMVAGALNLLGEDTLFGRYWGCLEDYKFLHFETCYYQAIQFAIENGVRRVEAGAQGPHKLQRGYLPVRIYSAHWIADKGFSEAIEDYLERERAAVDHEIDAMMKHSPFKQDS